MSDIQAELFQACKALAPTGYGLGVHRRLVTPRPEFMWDVVVYEDAESDDDPEYFSMFTIDARQWNQWSNAEREFNLKVRMGDCVANIQNAKEGLLD